MKVVTDGKYAPQVSEGQLLITIETDNEAEFEGCAAKQLALEAGKMPVKDATGNLITFDKAGVEYYGGSFLLRQATKTRKPIRARTYRLTRGVPTL